MEKFYLPGLTDHGLTSADELLYVNVGGFSLTIHETYNNSRVPKHPCFHDFVNLKLV